MDIQRELMCESQGLGLMNEKELDLGLERLLEFG